MSTFDQEKYAKAKSVAVRFFEKNRKIHSICLGDIYLNSDGFMHLIWKKKAKKHKRNLTNQVKRFYLLPYIKPILKGMKYYQEYMENLEKIRLKKNKVAVFESKLVRYWAFVAVINNKIRIKVVLRKIGNGNIHFWSIIPIWKTKEYKDVKIVSLHKGNLSED